MYKRLVLFLLLMSTLNAESIVSRQAGWSNVQKEAECAVMQVFSQIAEPHILSPYRVENGEGRGTAFFVSESGKILTNYHVIAGSVRVVVQMPLLFGKKMIEVDVVSVCPERDVALLQLRPEDRIALCHACGSVPYLQLGDSNNIDRSDELLALGFPLGQESLKSATGVVSGEEHASIESRGRTVEARCIQVSTPINPGNSGGPALNRKGEVVGINTAAVGAAQNVGYILPINEYHLIKESLEKHVLVKKPDLGASYCYAEDGEIAQFLGNPLPAGCYLTKVQEYGLIKKIGLRAGDMIYTVNGFVVDAYGYVQLPGKGDRVSVSDYISSLALGTELVIEMYRSGEKHILKDVVHCPSEPPIRWKYTGYDAVDYEIIGGLLIQELSLNIVSFFYTPQISQQMPHIRDYLSAYRLDDAQRGKSALIVTQLFSSSCAHRTRAIGLGEIIEEVNGKKVATLQELRDALEGGISNTFITFKTRDCNLVVLNSNEVMQDEVRLSNLFKYTITPHMQKMMTSVGGSTFIFENE